MLAIINELVGMTQSNNCFPDPQPMKSSKPLSLTDFEDENVFEEDTFVTSSSLTDV